MASKVASNIKKIGSFIFRGIGRGVKHASHTKDTVVHVVRHGEKEGDALTEQGKEQVREAGRSLARELNGKEVDISFLHSPTNRTTQSADAFQKAFLEEAKNQNVKVVSTGLHSIDTLIEAKENEELVKPLFEKYLKANKNNKVEAQKAFMKDWHDGKIPSEVIAETHPELFLRAAEEAMDKPLKSRARNNPRFNERHTVLLTHSDVAESLLRGLRDPTFTRRRGSLAGVGGLTDFAERYEIRFPGSTIPTFRRIVKKMPHPKVTRKGKTFIIKPRSPRYKRPR